MDTTHCVFTFAFYVEGEHRDNNVGRVRVVLIYVQ